MNFKSTKLALILLPKTTGFGRKMFIIPKSFDRLENFSLELSTKLAILNEGIRGRSLKFPTSSTHNYFDVRRVALGVTVSFALKSRRVEFALHHVEKNGDRRSAQFRLG